MSRPCAFNSVARWLAALLGDCLMRAMRDAMIERGFMSGAFNCGSGAQSSLMLACFTTRAHFSDSARI